MNPLTKCELNLKPIKQQITELVATERRDGRSTISEGGQSLSQ